MFVCRCKITHLLQFFMSDKKSNTWLVQFISYADEAWPLVNDNLNPINTSFPSYLIITCFIAANIISMCQRFREQLIFPFLTIIHSK